MLRTQLVLLINGINYGVEQGSQMSTILSRCGNFLMSLSLITPLFILGVYYPYVGQIGALLAAFATIMTIYIMPIMCYLREKWDVENKSSISDRHSQL